MECYIAVHITIMIWRERERGLPRAKSSPVWRLRPSRVFYHGLYRYVELDKLLINASLFTHAIYAPYGFIIHITLAHNIL